MSNLYVAFLALSVALLNEQGQIAAITPRSFANGPYFRSFRRYFLAQMRFERIHLFESRSSVFAGDAVLQENIIFAATRNAELPSLESVVISGSFGSDHAATHRKVPHSEVVDPQIRCLHTHRSE